MACRLALRRVLDREARYQARRRRMRRERADQARATAGHVVKHVFADFFLRPASVKFPDPEAEEGAGGRESDFASPVSLLRYLGSVEGTRMGWDEGDRAAGVARGLGQRYRRYRLADPEAEEAMAGSLRRWGQLSPVVACVREEKLELLDGFKRWSAARQIAGLTS